MISSSFLTSEWPVWLAGLLMIIGYVFGYLCGFGTGRERAFREADREINLGNILRKREGKKRNPTISDP